MLGFFGQLRLLLWKNIVLRRRQKARAVVELIWPLFLFLILMWVRTRGLKEYKHECHFEEKAMPSSGLLPFMRSFLCTMNNTCHSRVVDDDRAPFHQEEVDKMFGDTEAILGRHFDPDARGSFARLRRDVANLLKILNSPRDVSKDSQQDTLDVSSLWRDQKALAKAIRKEDLGLTPRQIRSILGAKIKVSGIDRDTMLDLARDPKSVLCDQSKMAEIAPGAETQSLCELDSGQLRWLAKEAYEQANGTAAFEMLSSYVESNAGERLGWVDWRKSYEIWREVGVDLREMQAVKESMERIESRFTLFQSVLENDTAETNMTAFLAGFSAVQRMICGEDNPGFLNEMSERWKKTTRFDEIRDQLKESSVEKEINFRNDTDATPECNNLFYRLETSRITKFLWIQVKPLIRGKILFAPTTPATVDLMDRVNAHFGKVETLQRFAEWVVESLIPRLREMLGNDTALAGSIRTQLESPPAKKILNWFMSATKLASGEVLNSQVDGLLQEEYTLDQILDTMENGSAEFLTYLQCFSTDKTEGHLNEADAVDRGMELLEDNRLWALIVFPDIHENDTSEELPTHLRYKLRMDSDRVDSTFQIVDRIPRPRPRRRPGIDLKYLTYGFAYLQDLIEHDVIRMQTGRETLPGVFLKQFPYPCYIHDQFILAISRTFPLFMTLSWVYTSAMIIKSIVHEKERRLKETMRVMGLGNAVHWAGWLIDSFAVMFFTVLLLTCILVFGNVIENSDPSLVLAFLTCHVISTISTSFLISTWFSKANLAAAAGGMIFFVFYLPYPFMIIWEEKVATHSKVIASLLSNVAFGFGCSYFAHWEEIGMGAHWDNFLSSPRAGDEFSLGKCMAMQLFDALIYALFTWYIEAVWPGEFGMPKRWYFFMQKSYWCDTSVETTDAHAESVPLNQQDLNVESEPTHLPLGVSIQGLRKVYDNGKVAVDGLNLNFYEDQITAFLGHNGAGKTTTISILTGLLTPTAGTATIYGLDIRTDMDHIRKSLGTCPQHNVLFDKLTVEEHLWFYARLKGRSEKEVNLELSGMILDLGLPHKRNELAENLSGGMQRKLSVAAAFVGGSRTVILDEPTSGVDPYSRRSIWDLLLKYKKGRTIILTTHFMDEADLLGNRIAIIANGSLRCCGSSLFLKSAFGSGYYLCLVKQNPEDEVKEESVEKSSNRPNGDVSNLSGADEDEEVWQRRDLGVVGGSQDMVDTVTKFIQGFIPGAEFKEDVGSEILYVLPARDTPTKSFEKLFQSLDSSLASLKISSYGVSDTTLEEIFLKVAEASEFEESGSNPPSWAWKQVNSARQFQERWRRLKSRIQQRQCPSVVPVSVDMGPTTEGNSTPTNTTQTTTTLTTNTPSPQKPGLPLDDPLGHPLDKVCPNVAPRRIYWRQWQALLAKRFHHTRRNRKGFLFEIVLPAMFVCLTMAATRILPPVLPEPASEMHPWRYGPPPPNHIFYANRYPDGKWASKYEERITGEVGIGTRCLRGDPISDYPCDRSVKMVKTDRVGDRAPPFSPPCSCEKGTPICPPGAGGPPPPMTLTPAGHTLVNMDGRNLTDWIVKTSREYYKRRYGGFELGVHHPHTSSLNITGALSTLDRLAHLIGLDPGDLLTVDMTSLLHTSEWMDNIRVWFNNKGWITSVAYMNAVNNVVLRASLGEAEGGAGKDEEDYGMTLINHPMDFTRHQIVREVVKQGATSLLHSICVIFALSFVPASFVVYLIEERESKSKHLQLVSGAHPLLYWSVNFAWDMLNYLVPAALCLLIFLAFEERAYVSADNLPATAMLLILYGFATIPLMYPASFAFSVPSTAFVALACANLFLGVVSTVSTFVLELFDDQELQDIAAILKVVFLILPHYCFGRGIIDLAANEIATESLQAFGMKLNRNRFDWYFIGRNLFCMFIQGLICFLLVLLIEFKPWEKWTKKKEEPSSSSAEYLEEEDEDVSHERRRIRTAVPSKEAVLLRDVTKTYRKGTKPAVDRISVAVERAQCFGLLGVNGAGKTSTFKMLTGDVPITSGEAWVNGHSVRRSLSQVHRSLGYCPQSDGLDSLLTGREHLRLYARLRGIPEEKVKDMSEVGLRRMGLATLGDKPAGTYSGGNKRKLSTAMALVGDPPLVFLDEPTSGMDPRARRFLWGRVLDMVREGRSIVLTSHSMEECEALCGRLAVMVNGRVKCIGSVQHLKNRFGSGYTLVVRCRREANSGDGGDALDLVATGVTKSLPDAILISRQHNQLQFRLPMETCRLADVFCAMDMARKELPIHEFSISQTTLDEVFIHFASEQTEMWEEEAKAAEEAKHRRRAWYKSIGRRKDHNTHPSENGSAV